MMTRKFNLLFTLLGVLVTSAAYPQVASRTVMVNSNTGSLLYPTNFWSVNASAARNGLSLAAHATNPVVAVANGGTGGTNAESARTNLGLGTAATNASSAFQPATAALSNFVSGSYLVALANGGTGATNAAAARTNLGLGTAATNASTAFQPASSVLSNMVSGSYIIALSNGGTGATNAVEARTALGLGTAATNASSAFQPASSSLTNLAANNGGGLTNLNASGIVGAFPAASLPWSGLTNTNAAGLRASLELSGTWLTNTNAANFRAAIGIPWTGLTNTNASTFSAALGLVVEQNFTNMTGSETNNATNARTLLVNSIAPSVAGITNTVILPVDAATVLGDIVTVTHTGPTSSTTVVRASGTTNELVSLNQSGASARFVYRGSVWSAANELVFAGPVVFVGTNAASNAAISRTNLDMPLAALTSTSAAAFQGAIFAATNAAPTNTTNVNAWVDLRVGTNSFKIPLYR